ncbi:MAG: RNA chaperone Hfq [Thermodesulfobacteriota bacterium]
MVKNQFNIQDQFLNRVRKDRSHVTVELIGGRKIDGTVLSFDNFCVLLRGETDQLLYKHAIASIHTNQKIELFDSK